MSDPVWLTKAKTCLGLAAGREHGDNPDVLAFYRDAGHPEIAHDTVPWCAAFVGGILAIRRRRMRR